MAHRKQIDPPCIDYGDPCVDYSEPRNDNKEPRNHNKTARNDNTGPPNHNKTARNDYVDPRNHRGEALNDNKGPRNRDGEARNDYRVPSNHYLEASNHNKEGRFGREAGRTACADTISCVAATISTLTPLRPCLTIPPNWRKPKANDVSMGTPVDPARKDHPGEIQQDAAMKSDNNLLQVHFLLQGARVPVPVSRICEALECSPPTVHRIIAEMRNSHDAPIRHQRNHPPGYIYTDKAFELPMGVWFSEQQVLALLAVHQLLKSFQPGLLDPLVDPLREKYSAMVDSQGLTEIMGKRVRLLRAAARDPGPCFNIVATALVQRKRLNIDYDARSTGQASNRDISPQRLIHYRDNWFLDAWCHKQNELRIFSLDCIRQARQLKTAADEIPDDVLDGKLGGSYGIFAGEPTAIARLKFTPFRSRWVSREQWHPQQQGHFLDTGEYVLEIPYHRSEELINDILRHGPDVQVLEPVALREEVVARLRETLERYS